MNTTVQPKVPRVRTILQKLIIVLPKKAVHIVLLPMCDYVSKKVLNANLPSNRADTMHQSKYMFRKSPRNNILVSVKH